VVAARIRIEVGSSRHAGDLVRALAVRGFSSSIVEGGDQVELEISYEHEQTWRLLSDLIPALERWVDESGTEVIVKVCLRGPVETGVGRLRPRSVPGDGRGDVLESAVGGFLPQAPVL
jgi:hypothetical protein